MVDNSVLKVNDKTYLVVDTICDNDNKYVYFLNEKDEKDFFIKKETKDPDGKTYLTGLNNNDEFIYALKLFEENNK